VKVSILNGHQVIAGRQCIELASVGTGPQGDLFVIMITVLSKRSFHRCHFYKIVITATKVSKRESEHARNKSTKSVSILQGQTGLDNESKTSTELPHAYGVTA
jgi:hypothetical protein